MVVSSVVHVLVDQLLAIDFDLVRQVEALPVGLRVVLVLPRGIPRDQYTWGQLLGERNTHRLAMSFSLSTGTLPFLIASSSRFPSYMS